MRVLTSLLAVLSYVCSAHGAVEYYGKFLGPLATFHHGVTGDVYAVDARTLHIRNFNYDGEGPAAYFYVGTTKVVNGNGLRLLDEKGLPYPLKRYRRKHITLTLPDGKTVSNIKWLSVYCDEAQVNFADVKVPKGLDFPKPQKVAALNGVHGVTSEPVVIVDAQTLLIPSFSYDGEAPDAKFWVGRGAKPSPQGIRVPDENGKETPLRRYDRKTIVLTLPADLTVYDIGHFGIWCEAFTVDFGHVQIPQGLNVPPSLKMLGVSPQKRSRSLQLSALQQPQQQQLQQALPSNSNNDNVKSGQDKNYNSNFNYQNVLPLFNVQETIRPTTYRPQLFVQQQQQQQPITVELGSLQHSDHRFSQKQTHGYLPLNNYQAQQQQLVPIHNRFPPTPSVQIIPSISLNDDNGLIVQNQFDLGPPLAPQFLVDPNFINQQFQYEQFRQAQSQPQFLINVQDEQVPFHRPIRKESDRPSTGNSVQSEKPEEKNKPVAKSKQQPDQPKVPQEPVVAAENLTPEAFQIPLVIAKETATVSPVTLKVGTPEPVAKVQPVSQTPLPAKPAEILTVPFQFLNNGVFSSDFGTFPPKSLPVTRPKNSDGNFGAVIPRPVSRLRAFDPVPAFKNNPTGSFSRFVLSTKSGVSDTVVRY